MNTKREKITIQLSFNENTFSFTASVAPNHNKNLFTFRFEGGKWLFYTYWLESRSDASVRIPGGFDDDFPIEYFIKLCQARYMVSAGALDFPEVELSKSARKMLTRGFVAKEFTKKYGPMI